MRATIICTEECVNSHSSSTAIHMPALLDLTLNQGMWLLVHSIVKSSNWSVDLMNSVRVFLIISPWDREKEREREIEREVVSGLSRLSCTPLAGTVEKHNLLAAVTFCKIARDWSDYMWRRSWLAQSVLLTEGGLPESWKRWKQKKFQLQSCTMRLPCVGLE